MTTFTPPTRVEAADDRFWGRYGIPVGISLLLRNGHFEEVPFPWLGETCLLVEGRTWFQGGRVYEVDEATAAALAADGYGESIELGYGAGGYGLGNYGGTP